MNLRAKLPKNNNGPAAKFGEAIGHLLFQRKPQMLGKGLMTFFRIMHAVKGDFDLPIGGINEVNTQLPGNGTVGGIEMNAGGQKPFFRDPRARSHSGWPDQNDSGLFQRNSS